MPPDKTQLPHQNHFSYKQILILIGGLVVLLVIAVALWYGVSKFLAWKELKDSAQRQQLLEALPQNPEAAKLTPEEKEKLLEATTTR